MLSDGELIVGDVVSLECAGVAGECLFELFEFFLEGLLQVAHDFGALSLEVELADGLLHRDADVRLLYYVLHLNIIHPTTITCTFNRRDFCKINKGSLLRL